MQTPPQKCMTGCLGYGTMNLFVGQTHESMYGIDIYLHLSLLFVWGLPIPWVWPPPSNR